MTESFAVLADAARQVLARCPWTAAHTAERYAPELRSEADEVLLAIANEDHDNLKEELGDLLWDVLMCALLAERSGHFPAHEVFDDVVAKMQRRKPFVFDGTEVTVEDAQRIWGRGQGTREAAAVSSAVPGAGRGGCGPAAQSCGCLTDGAIRQAHAARG